MRKVLIVSIVASLFACTELPSSPDSLGHATEVGVLSSVGDFTPDVVGEESTDLMFHTIPLDTVDLVGFTATATIKNVSGGPVPAGLTCYSGDTVLGESISIVDHGRRKSFNVSLYDHCGGVPYSCSAHVNYTHTPDREDFNAHWHLGVRSGVTPACPITPAQDISRTCYVPDEGRFEHDYPVRDPMSECQAFGDFVDAPNDESEFLIARCVDPSEGFFILHPIGALNNFDFDIEECVTTLPGTRNTVLRLAGCKCRY